MSSLVLQNMTPIDDMISLPFLNITSTIFLLVVKIQSQRVSVLKSAFINEWLKAKN